MTLKWRTAPRSIIKTLYWFKSLGPLENDNWNKKLDELSNMGTSVHPIRRQFLINIANSGGDDDNFTKHKVEEIGKIDFILGRNDWTKEPESNSRQKMATFREFGLAFIENGIIKITPTGGMVLSDNFDGNQLIAQMLKMYTAFDNGGVYIFQLFLKMLSKFHYLNRWEVGFIFGVSNMDDVSNLENVISDFRNKYNHEKNKNKKSETISNWISSWNKYFGKIKNNPSTYYSDYTDAFFRSLIFTGLFIDSGRGEASKIRVKEIEQEKINMLLDLNVKVPDETKDSIDQMDWFGDSDNIILPWLNLSGMEKILKNKSLRIKSLKPSAYDKLNAEYSLDEIGKYSFTISKLKIIEKKIDEILENFAIDHFVEVSSKEKSSRDEIIERYEMINDDSTDMAALWLEANTWKFFASLACKPDDVKYNGKLNEDLTPRSYAKGVGNTPDMEVYNANDILLPEVSLMSGAQQWEHEGSSVAEHVFRKKEKNEDKNVMALFLSKKTSFRSEWLFFMLNKDSWSGEPVPVVPIEIEQFIDIVNFSYDNNVNISDLIHLFKKQSEIVADINNFNDWKESMDEILYKWKKEFVS
ncbi:AlwI family type II restriction endonuclease [Fructilactobacillus frigidiflavus]|uniref:AlwI family type II restriction endonuclease n=1 Tax=Fructilactobacillus frigidiflavus TaxID=3242688 RepID=UPI003757CB73